MSGENISRLSRETIHRISGENLNRLSRENTSRLSRENLNRLSRENTYRFSRENSNRFSRGNATRSSGDVRSINSTKVRYEADAEGIGSRKVSFHLSESTRAERGRQGAVERRRGRQKEAEDTSARRRRTQEVCLVAAALLLVWVLYGIPVVVLGIAQTKINETKVRVQLLATSFLQCSK